MLILLPLLALFAAEPPPIAITGASVIDGTGAPPRQATVVIRGGRIESVGDGPIPADARVIRAGNRTLLPGLFDLHTHLSASAAGISGDWQKSLLAYLYCGVTSVVDFAGYGEMFEPLRRLADSGTVPGPRVLHAARITTPAGHGSEAGWGDFFTAQVSNPEEARAAMKTILLSKPDAIKVFTDGWRYGTGPDLTSMDEATLAAIVEEAHRAKLPVLTHTVTIERDKIAARAGVDVIDHGAGNALADDELTGLLLSHHVTYAPTLAVYEPRAGRASPPLLREILEPAARELPRPAAPAGQVPRSRRWQFLAQNVALLARAGVPIGASTDAGMPGTYHGWSTLHELELLVQSGLTPLEAITAATSGSARAIHVDASRGTIAPGKLADLVLIDGAPHQNISDILRVERVFLGGRELDRAALRRGIESPAISPLPARAARRLIDDMESSDGRTRLGTLRVNSYDPGTDHSRILFSRSLRTPSNHSLLVVARMSEKQRPFARLDLPLSPGAIEPVDASAFKGVRFECRGEGEYRLIVAARAVRDYDPFAAKFSAGAKWKTVRIPFTALSRAKPGPQWTGSDLTALSFELARPGGSTAWLELDDIRFY